MHPEKTILHGAFDFQTGYSVTYGNAASCIRPVAEYSLADLLNKYGDLLWENGSHKYNVTSFIGELDELLLGQKFSTFGQETLDFLVGRLRENGNSNATINRKLAALRKLLRKAYKMGDIYSLPEFRREKERAGRIRYLDDDEEALLFAKIRDRSEDCWRLSVFLVDTGARLGEALKVRWPDLDERRVTFWVTKSGRSRSVPLTSRARAVASQKFGHSRGPFCHMAPHRYRAVWNDAKTEMGLADDKDLVPHVLRHTCASRLVKGGIDIRRIQMWLGHQTLTMTMRYAHLATFDLDNCVAVLERSAPTQDARRGPPEADS
ncbi:MAG: site-specific integrase [Rhizobiales bacterium]|nr:site-specific integrase [Hyphomicrobiales bacterium]OJU35327.1 MAG: integrase [Rhizobiales bacterium 68-8]